MSRNISTSESARTSNSPRLLQEITVLRERKEEVKNILYRSKEQFGGDDLDNLLEEERSLTYKINNVLKSMNEIERRYNKDTRDRVLCDLDFSQKKLSLPNLEMIDEESYFFSLATWKKFKENKGKTDLKSGRLKSMMKWLQEQVDNNKDRTGKHDKCDIKVGCLRVSPYGAPIKNTLVVSFTQKERTLKIVFIEHYILLDESN